MNGLDISTLKKIESEFGSFDIKQVMGGSNDVYLDRDILTVTDKNNDLLDYLSSLLSSFKDSRINFNLASRSAGVNLSLAILYL